MKQRISLLTIAADDLPAMKGFYNEIFEWKPVAENNDIVFYKLNGFLFRITKRRELADFIGINPHGNVFRSITIAYNVGSEQEVWDLFKQLKHKGVKILKEPTVPAFGGLFFYLEDIENNIWEIAYNSFIPM